MDLPVHVGFDSGAVSAKRGHPQHEHNGDEHGGVWSDSGWRIDLSVRAALSDASCGLQQRELSATELQHDRAKCAGGRLWIRAGRGGCAKCNETGVQRLSARRTDKRLHTADQHDDAGRSGHLPASSRPSSHAGADRQLHGVLTICGVWNSDRLAGQRRRPELGQDLAGDPGMV